MLITGGRAVIGALGDALAMLEGRSGTTVEGGAEAMEWETAPLLGAVAG